MRFIIGLTLMFLLTGCTMNDMSLVSDSTTMLYQPQGGPFGVANQVDHVANSTALGNATTSGNQSILSTQSTLSTFVNWPVKFASQAPLGDWGMPYQEACEEASLILADKYFNNEPLDKQIMDAEIKKVVAWETANLGLYTDTNVDEVVRIAKEYFNFNATISADVSIDNIKTQLADGKLIIAPFAGRMLGNPNYSGKGPIYHFMLIRGYDEKSFITNDVGTRKGDGYKYDYNTLINAIHDLPVDADGAIFRPYDSALPDVEKAAKLLTGTKKLVILSGTSH